MRLHVEASGTGAVPLVCLHGWGLNLRVFDGLREQLPPGQAVIGIDLPGHGGSGWDAARASFEAQAEWLLEHLPERCHLLGWSLGGQLALQLATRAPARVATLILIATTPRFAAGADWVPGLAQPVMQRFAEHLARDWQGTVREFLQLQVRGSRDAQGVLALLEQALQAQGQARPAALRAGLEILNAVDLRARLPAVTAPALLITGQHDSITPPAAGVYLAQALRTARLAELKRAGHAPFLSHPAAVSQLVRDFLAAA